MNGHARITIAPIRMQKRAVTGATKNAPMPYRKGEQVVAGQLLPAVEFDCVFIVVFRWHQRQHFNRSVSGSADSSCASPHPTGKCGRSSAVGSADRFLSSACAMTRRPRCNKTTEQGGGGQQPPVESLVYS